MAVAPRGLVRPWQEPWERLPLNPLDSKGNYSQGCRKYTVGSYYASLSLTNLYNVVVVVTEGLHVPDTTICYRPPSRAHAIVSLYKDSYGVVAIYTCQSGYFFAEGGTVRTVLCKNAEWSHDVPDCERTLSPLFIKPSPQSDGFTRMRRPVHLPPTKEEVNVLPVFVCLSVCLLARLLKTRAWIWMKCCG